MADTPSSPAPPPLSTWQMVKMFGPIVFFSILLPFVDIVTDLRMIITLYTGIQACDKTRIRMNWDWDTYRVCLANSSTFCQQTPSLCNVETHPTFATMLLSK